MSSLFLIVDPMSCLLYSTQGWINYIKTVNWIIECIRDWSPDSHYDVVDGLLICLSCPNVLAVAWRR